MIGDAIMWHHKTKLGTFWIVESEDNHQFYLGMDEESLGRYQRLEDAIRDIEQQATGYLKWDMAKKPSIPESIAEWEAGEPESWNEF